MPNNPLVFFIIKIFICLPICYFVWYFTANYSILLLAYVSEFILQFFFPYIIKGIEQSGHLLDIIIKVNMPSQDIPTGMEAELPISINPLKYTYGLALCIALILASAKNWIKTIQNMVLSILLLLPFQVWGIYFEVMYILFFKTEPGLIEYMFAFPWQLDIIAICYQIGSLLLPPISPVIIWLFLYQDFLYEFAPSFRTFNR